jgi:hypothetical protein
MKKRSIPVIATIIGAVVLLSSCDGLNLPLSDSERLDAFIATANESPRDYVIMQSHFSESAPGYPSMNTSSFWESTPFELANRPFTVSNTSAGGEVGAYPGSTSITATIELGGPSLTNPVTFVFVDDSATVGNRVLRAIDHNNDGTFIQNRVGD